MRLSVVIPAYNEERYLGDTLLSIAAARKHLHDVRAADTVEVLVVDNDSDDRTAELARDQGCRIVSEEEHNISKVRNAGARAADRAADGDVVVFIDADTIIPERLLELIAQRMDDPKCVGGAVDVHHKPAGRIMKCYVAAWRILGMVTGMAQGATQFCRRTVFEELGGYDETVFMGEDVEFFWSMKRAASKSSGHVAFIREVRVVPSPRRYDQWSLWKTLVKTNPLYILWYRKVQRAWPGWYKDRPH